MQAGGMKAGVPVRFTAVRKEAEFGHPYDTKATARYRERELAANKLVTLSPRVRKLADEVTAGKSGLLLFENLTRRR